MSRLPAVLLVCVVAAVAAGIAVQAGVLGPAAGGAVAGAAGVAIVAAVVAGSVWPHLQLFGTATLRGGGPHLALTFDDGPDPCSTPALLDALERADARATFFVLVDRAEAHPDLARAIADRHELALHGRSHHPWLTLYPPRHGEAELREAADRLEQLTGVRPTWFRPPFGVTSPRLFASAARAGLTVVWCSIRTHDGGSLGPEALRARCRRAGPGDIVLMHEGPRAATTALPDILADLRDRGLRSVTVGELIA